MSEQLWKNVVAELQSKMSEPNPAQKEAAALLNVVLVESMPRPVAAAALKQRLRQALCLPEPNTTTESQIEYLNDLCYSEGSAPPDVEDVEFLNAWVAVFQARRAVSALRKWQPRPGDIVRAGARGDDNVLGEVSSISSDGRLNFRGGGGKGIRPHLITEIIRRTEPGYAESAYKAAQLAAARVSDPELKVASRLPELERWRVDHAPEFTAVQALRDELDTAQHEDPLQVVLTKHPEILASLIDGHHGAYVIPKPMLGKEYVPDFLICGLTSLGLRWTLVELESPTAHIHIADGQAAKQLRKAVKQITDWREWLGTNLDYARRPRSDNGLGLPGIRADAQGLIIIGRGQLSEMVDVTRVRMDAEQRISVRSYDWLERAAASPHPMSWGKLDYESLLSTNE